jgi:Ca2+-binding EF-hand superfamily protein
LVNYYDKDIDGCVHIQDFLLDLRQRPNEIRQNMIDIAFKKFDIDGSGYVDIRDLK